jgi:GTPase SAR1 family protein
MFMHFFIFVHTFIPIILTITPTPTHTHTQAVAEMKEKNKILQNEVEILRNESLARDRALAEEMRIHQSAKNTRDAERFERDKLLTTLRQKKELQKQQVRFMCICVCVCEVFIYIYTQHTSLH